MKQMILYFLLLVSVNALSQDSTQIYSYGGKKLKVSSEYDCSKKYALVSTDFSIANLKLPTFLYKMSDKEELINEFDEAIEEDLNVLEKRNIEFKSFGQKLSGYLYKIEKEGKIRFMISSLGVVEDPIYLTILIEDEKLDIDNFNLPPEVYELLNITELN